MTSADLHRAIEVLAIINLVAIGISHLVQPRAWVRFFTMLRAKGEPGVFIIAFIHLGIGSLVVAFHHVWTGWGLVLTVLGWLWVLKSVVYFATPGLGLRALAHVSEDRLTGFRVAGAALLLVAAMIAINVFTG